MDGKLGSGSLVIILAFLLAPAFFLLLALFLWVILLRETIIQLLKWKYSPSPFIKASCNIVKSPLFVIAIFQGFPSMALANGPQDHVISIGEHLEIPTRGLQRFSVTDQDVIAYKWLEQQTQFLVEGKKIGYSELIIWDQYRHKTTHRFYVISRRSFLKLKQIQKTLEAMHLETSLQGHILVAKGQIQEKRDYFILHKIWKQNSKRLHLDVKLEKKLRNHLIAKAYQILFREISWGISCVHEGIQITCFHPKKETLPKKMAQKLKRDYSIDLVAKSHRKAQQNYRVRLLIFQFERTDGKELSLGLDQLQITGEELFSQGIPALVSKNRLLLKKNHIEVSTLAWPETLSLPYQESIVEMGAEIPYESEGPHGKKLKWKFAGIRLKMSLHPQGHQIKVQYLVEVKHPGEQGQVSGSRNQSIAALKLGKVQEIFQIGLQTTRGQKGALPGLHQIPLLGKIFTSSQKGQNFKKIVGYLKIEQKP